MPEAGSICIRDAGPQDAEAVAGLVAALAAELQERSPITTAYAADYLRTLGGHALLPVRGQAVLGLLSYVFRPSLCHAADACLVDELVVEPGARDQGVGELLLEEVIRRARLRRGLLERDGLQHGRPALLSATWI